MTFGEKVRNERNRLGLSQDELAKQIGVSRRVISSYENDSSRPRGTERYQKLADSLGVNINYLRMKHLSPMWKITMDAEELNKQKNFLLR